MDINYKNLNSFETLGILLATVGVVLGFTFMFAALPDNQQRNFTQALNIFDVHEAVAAESQTLQFAYSSMNDYFNQFYIAFAEVATLSPDDYALPTKAQLAEAYSYFTDYSDQVAADFNKNNSGEKSVYYNQGKVLGVSIDLSVPVPKPVPVQTETHYEIIVPRLPLDHVQSILHQLIIN